MRLQQRLQDPEFMMLLRKHQEVNIYQSPSTGKITYNKIVNKRSFAVFKDIIKSIVPIDVVLDDDSCREIPSIAKVLKPLAKEHGAVVLPYYFYMTPTQSEYMEHENEQDDDEMTMLYEYLDDYAPKTPVIGVCVFRSEDMQSAHAIAFIAWKSERGRRLKFAFYDPLSYKRGKRSYDYSELAFVPERFSSSVDFINLHPYCFSRPEQPGDYHCLQYMSDQEICYVYSIFFLDKWLRNGAKLHRATFRKTVKDTYVVDPAKLTRTDNKESMVFRMVMMAFICRSFLAYLRGLGVKARKHIVDADAHIEHIREYLRGFKELYGFDLLRSAV